MHDNIIKLSVSIDQTKFFSLQEKNNRVNIDLNSSKQSCFIGFKILIHKRMGQILKTDGTIQQSHFTCNSLPSASDCSCIFVEVCLFPLMESCLT